MPVSPSKFPRGRACVVLLAWASLAAALWPDRARGQSPELRTQTLAQGPCGRMSTLFEKTFLQFDVLRLEIRFGPRTARDLNRIVRGRSYSESLGDSVAATALGARNVLASADFQRGVGFERFHSSIRDNLEETRQDGIIDPEAYRKQNQQLPDWYSFLRGRGVKDGDRMYYRIRGDTLRTVYVSASGIVLLDQRDVGTVRRRSVLGGYFASGSSFRDGLVRSLVEGCPGRREAGAAAPLVERD